MFVVGAVADVFAARDILDAQVLEGDAATGLTRVRVGRSGTLRLRAPDLIAGAQVRVQVRALYLVERRAEPLEREINTPERRVRGSGNSMQARRDRVVHRRRDAEVLHHLDGHEIDLVEHEHELLVGRRENGALVVHRTPIAIDDTPLRIRGVVSDSLYQAARAAGALMDGCVRDIKAIKAMKFPVFHGGIAPLDSKGRATVKAVDVPVECAGVGAQRTTLRLDAAIEPFTISAPALTVVAPV